MVKKIAVVLFGLSLSAINAFVSHQQTSSVPLALSSSSSPSSTQLFGKPQRLRENVEGPLYVNDRCINCAACSNFAPDTFRRNAGDSEHVVYRQPSTKHDIEHARAALAACPVAAIRLETLAERRHRASTIEMKQFVEDEWTDYDDDLIRQMSINPKTNGLPKPFPRPFLLSERENDVREDEVVRIHQLDHDQRSGAIEGVHWLGHHNERSFGATPYLLKAQQQNEDGYETIVYIMVDTPKFCPSAVRAVEEITGCDGPDYLFLTHVDDTADHLKWYEHYKINKNNKNNNVGSEEKHDDENDSGSRSEGKRGRGLRRIFHEGDAYEHNWLRDKSLQDVEILLSTPVTEDGSTLETCENTFVSYTLDGELLVQCDNGQDKWASWMTTKGEPVKDQVIILHTPGHSPGSLTLYRRPIYDSDRDENDPGKLLSPGILFTGDTYGYSTRGHRGGGGAMTAFPRFGDDLLQQAETIRKFLRLDWQVIAPGHGHPRDYRRGFGRGDDDENNNMRLRRIREEEMEVSIDELKSYQ